MTSPAAGGGLVRRLVAFAFHAPGLRLVYGERLTPDLARYNQLAVVATIGLIFIAYQTAPEGASMTRAAIAFVAGHLAWGLFLALKLPAPER